MAQDIALQALDLDIPDQDATGPTSPEAVTQASGNAGNVGTNQRDNDQLDVHQSPSRPQPASWLRFSWACLREGPILAGATIVTLLITCLTLWPNFLALHDASTSLSLAEWTAMKDYLEWCGQQNSSSMSESCRRATEIGLIVPPPLTSLFANHQRRRISPFNHFKKWGASCEDPVELYYEHDPTSLESTAQVVILFLLGALLPWLWRQLASKRKLEDLYAERRSTIRVRRGGWSGAMARTTTPLEAEACHSEYVQAAELVEIAWSSAVSHGNPAHNSDMAGSTVRSGDDRTDVLKSSRQDYCKRWISSAGIHRDVIHANIQSYLGEDVEWRPDTGIGENEGEPGYSYYAFRPLSFANIQDLKAKSAGSSGHKRIIHDDFCDTESHLYKSEKCEVDHGTQSAANYITRYISNGSYDCREVLDLRELKFKGLTRTGILQDDGLDQVHTVNRKSLPNPTPTRALTVSSPDSTPNLQDSDDRTNKTSGRTITKDHTSSSSTWKILKDFVTREPSKLKQ